MSINWRSHFTGVAFCFKQGIVLTSWGSWSTDTQCATVNERCDLPILQLGISGMNLLRVSKKNLFYYKCDLMLINNSVSPRNTYMQLCSNGDSFTANWSKASHIGVIKMVCISRVTLLLEVFSGVRRKLPVHELIFLVLMALCFIDKAAAQLLQLHITDLPSRT